MYLGIDLGTSEVKVVLLEESGEITASASAPLEVLRPQPRWSEQSAESWWKAALVAVDKLEASHAARLGSVRGIGLSGQMHGATLLDGADQPAAAGHPVERRPLRRGVPRARDARAADARHHRQPGHARLHRAQADLGRASTSRRSSPR